MSSLFRQPGFDAVIEVPDSQHWAYLNMGYLYLGPVPLKFQEEELVPRNKPKKKQQQVVEQVLEDHDALGR